MQARSIPRCNLERDIDTVEVSGRWRVPNMAPPAPRGCPSALGPSLAAAVQAAPLAAAAVRQSWSSAAGVTVEAVQVATPLGLAVFQLALYPALYLVYVWLL